MNLSAYNIQSVKPTELILKAWLKQLLSFIGKRSFLDLAADVYDYIEEKEWDPWAVQELTHEQVMETLTHFDLLPEILYYHTERGFPEPPAGTDPDEIKDYLSAVPDLFDQYREVSLANGNILLLYRFQQNLVEVISEWGSRLDVEEEELDVWRESNAFRSCKISADKQSILLHFLGRMPAWVIFGYADASFECIKADSHMFHDNAPRSFYLPDEIEAVHEKYLAKQEHLHDTPFSVTIGTQEWTTHNLDTTQFRNSDLIPEAASYEEWEAAAENQSPAWCYYQNDPHNGASFGKLYNLYAVNDPRGMAPEGWHIPYLEDWETMINFLGDNANEQLKGGDDWQPDQEMASFLQRKKAEWEEEEEEEEEKEQTNSDVADVIAALFGKSKDRKYEQEEAFEEDDDFEMEDSSTDDADLFNETGFTALPGGGRGQFGNAFFALNDSAYFWTSTPVEEEELSDHAYFILIYEGDDTPQFGNMTNKKAGFSVRCVHERN
jgi:uncharacterized protein (TIGR02145 family)